MKNKVLVEVLLPAAGETFDVFLPLDCRMSDALKMVASALSELSNDIYIAKEDAVLCNAETGIIYNINMMVADLGIQNGSRLMLV